MTERDRERELHELAERWTNDDDERMALMHAIVKFETASVCDALRARRTQLVERGRRALDVFLNED